MILINLAFGTCFLLLGIIAGRKPEFISKYKLLVVNKKKIVDQEAFSQLVKWAFISGGLTIIISSLLSYLLHWPIGMMLSVFVPVTAVAIVLNIKGHRLEIQQIPDSDRTIALLVILTLILLSVAVFIIFS